MNKIEVLTHASALHDKAQLDALKSKLLDDLRAIAGFEIAEVKKPSGDCLAVILVLTGGVEREVLKTVAQLPPPSILIAHPGHNSLPASLEILARIRRDGGEGRILFGDAASIVPELQLELVLASAWKSLRFSRIGLIGEPSEWLVASDVDSAFLKGRLAVDLITVDIKELMDHIRSAAVSRKELAAFTREAKEIIGPDPEQIREAITVYQGLRALVDEYRLSACSVRCFDLVTDMHTTGCYALSRLNDEGIPAGCEGDLQTLFSLYIASLLSGQVAFMGNIASVDTDTNVVGLAHCMCPLSMAMHYTVYTHFESDLGIGISGTFPEGAYTMFRLGGERLDHLFVREGGLENTEFRNDLCRTQLRLRMTEPVDELLHSPLGNHHILIQGHHRKTIERFFERHLKP
jgi:L-fucose isomerase-like protein